MREFEQEFLNAYREGRQPRCLACLKPLIIEETVYRVRVWRWDEEAKRYRVSILDEGTERPCCLECHAEYPIWINEGKLLCDLGITY
jgi:hypothetical protein